MDDLASIFTRVVEHLCTQGEPARVEGGTACSYRLRRNGRLLKCAVGCLIADEHYNSAFEGFNLTEEAVQNMLRRSGISFKKGDQLFMMLRKLQNIHDEFDGEEETWIGPTTLRNKLVKVAIAYALPESLVPPIVRFEENWKLPIGAIE